MEGHFLWDVRPCSLVLSALREDIFSSKLGIHIGYFDYHLDNRRYAHWRDVLTTLRTSQVFKHQTILRKRIKYPFTSPS